MNYFFTETDSNYQIKIPLNFRGYKIKKPCGKGAFSSVVKVIDNNTKETYAAKIIPQKILKNQTRVKTMIDNEITILQKANHPNIIQLYEIVELTTKDDSYIILIEEFCKNGNLSNYLTTNGFKNDQEKLQISRGITEAIGHLHRQGIAHCDIKPDNVLLDSNKVPKLCDFNLSQFVQNADDSCRGGSKPYAAPELFKFERVDFLRADIWSLGIMIFSIAEMRYPYNEAEDARRGLLIINSKNKKLNAFSKRCLRIDPLKRATADQLLNDPYLTLDDQIEEDNVDDEEMIVNLKNEAESRPVTSPNLADAKKMKKGEVILSDVDLPPISDDHDDDIDSEIDDDLFEIIHGYRRSSPEEDDEDEVRIEKTIYKRKRPGHFDDINDNSEVTVSHNISSQFLNPNISEVTVSHNNSPLFLNSNNASLNDISEVAVSHNDNCGGGLEIQNDSFTFSVMLELGYDFELQSHSGSSQTDEMDENDRFQEDDFADYEIERIENRICDSLVKFKYEKKRKTKKKNGPHAKRKEKRDRNDDPDDM